MVNSVLLTSEEESTVNSVQRPVNREYRQGVGAAGQFPTVELQRRYERVIHALLQEPQRYFSDPMPPALSPILVIRRQNSDLVKCQVESGRQNFALYIKFCLVRNESRKTREREMQRMEKDVQVTNKLYEIFHGNSAWAVPRIVAFFPKDMAVVMEESKGKRLLDLISRSAGGYPRKQVLEELETYCYSVGQWLQMFQKIPMLKVDAPRAPHDQIEYVKLRLMKLVRAAKLRERESKRILRYLGQLCAAAVDGRARPSQVHGDLSLSNILVEPGHVTILDFSRYQIGSPFADLAYFYQRLENFLTHPFFRRTTITSLQDAFLEGYQPGFDHQHPLFRAFRVQHTVNYLVDLARTESLPPIKRLYQRWQYHKCLRGLKRLMLTS